MAWVREQLVLLSLNVLTFLKRNYGISLSISMTMGENWDSKKWHKVIYKTTSCNDHMLFMELSSIPITLQNQSFFSTSSLFWLTDLVAHQRAGWGVKPSWHFSGVFNGMKAPLPTHIGSLAENKIFITILLEPTRTLPLTEGVGASSPYPQREESGAVWSVTAWAFPVKKGLRQNT